MVKYVTPVSRSAAEGTVAKVYEGIREEFGVHAEAFTLHSPLPEVLAGIWMLCRETLIANGAVERPAKEAVATAVSSINRCPYCVDAHAAMLAAGGNGEVARRIELGDQDQIADPRLAKIVEWALATRSPGAPILRNPPFNGSEAPELISAALVFHYINRPVSVFCEETPFPLGRGLLWGAQLWLAGRRFRPFIASRPAPGDSLVLLAEAELPEDLAWARESPVLAGAWSRFASAVERAGENALPVEVRARVYAWLRSWQGESPGLRSDWIDEGLEGIAAEHQPAGRLALLAAVAPYRVESSVIESYRDGRPDSDVVSAVAWAGLAAARRVASWIS
jgi:AhpD family alkylhydroperoxidase